MLSFVIIMRKYIARPRKMPSPPTAPKESEMYNRYLTRLEELRGKGKISEKTYRELRSEYERKSRESSN